MSAVWEFDASNSGEPKWQSFDPAATTTIEEAFQRGDGTVKLTQGFQGKLGFHYYTINFSTMIQINNSTEKERAVRRVQ